MGKGQAERKGQELGGSVQEQQVNPKQSQGPLNSPYRVHLIAIDAEMSVCASRLRKKVNTYILYEFIHICFSLPMYVFV